jgi:hypothetical protein
MKQVFARIWKDIKAYGLTVGLVVALWATCNLLFDTACLFVFLTGLPCPGCGMGHALLSLVTGNIVQAHLYNPSIWIWLLLGMCFFLYRYILGRQCKWMGWVLAAVVVLTVAIYLYRMVNLFPSEPPLTYYEGNLLRSWF